MHPIVIVGAGLAAWTTVRELRKLEATTPITLVTADSGDFYAKPTLSNAFAQKRAPAELVTTPAHKMAESLQVTLMAHTRVTGIDPASHKLSSSQGDLMYRDLVLATGAQPVRVPLQGDAAERVLSVNSLDDFASFHGQLTASGGGDAGVKHVVIMGAGLIGCEFANDLIGAGYQVSVVDPSSRPLAALLPEGASQRLASSLGALGVQWHFEATVASVHVAGPRLEVGLSDGSSLTADLVLSAIGLKADTTLAQAAGIRCERGIQVDANLMTSAEGIYALGDAAQYQSAGNRTLPYVMPIMQAAKTLAAVLAGQPTDLALGLMPVAVKTPALPLTVLPPAPGVSGQWQADEEDVWRFLDEAGQQRGFVLAGHQTRQRMAQTKATLA
ncbi:MAG: hypothetical protein RLZZ464_1882 [Pseudomonadota bacterium]|jgi:rubredoxin-NAD+ reductase